MMSEFDQIWNEELLNKFMDKYKNVPKIIEARAE